MNQTSDSNRNPSDGNKNKQFPDNNAPFSAPLWERVLSYVAMFLVVVVVLFLAVRNTPFRDNNLVVFVRILISLAAGTWGATIPGMFNVEAFYRSGLKTQGLIRAGGAAAFFLVTFFGTPKVLGDKLPVVFEEPTLEVSSAGHSLEAVSPTTENPSDQRIIQQRQLWKKWITSGMGISGNDRLLILRANFDQAYLPFCLRLEFPDCAVKKSDGAEVAIHDQDSVFELRQGVAFLVDIRRESITGQLDFVINVDGQGMNPTNDNLLKVEGSSQGQTLLIVAHLVARNGQQLKLEQYSPFSTNMVRLDRISAQSKCQLN